MDCAECGVYMSDMNAKPECRSKLYRCSFIKFDPVINAWFRGAAVPLKGLGGEVPWQQDTRTQSESEHSYSRGISNLAELLEQTSVQHLMLVGIFYDLLGSFPPNTGAEEIMPEAVQTFASFAKHRDNLADLLSHARTAHRDLMNSQQQAGLTTSKCGNNR